LSLGGSPIFFQILKSKNQHFSFPFDMLFYISPTFKNNDLIKQLIKAFNDYDEICESHSRQVNMKPETEIALIQGKSKWTDSIGNHYGSITLFAYPACLFTYETAE
jgi:hypothetical protein